MRNSHAFFRRIDVRAWLLVVALGGISLNAGAVNSGNIGRMAVTQNGRVTTLNHPGGTNSGGSTIPVSPNLGGWTTAGNYGVPPTATGPTIGNLTASGEFVVSGAGGNVRYPFQTSTPISLASLATATAGLICAVATGGGCVAAAAGALALPYISDWLDRAGLRRNPESGVVEQDDGTGCTKAPCYRWRLVGPLGYTSWVGTASEACRLANTVWASKEYDWQWLGTYSVERGVCFGRATKKTDGSTLSEDVTLQRGETRAPDPPKWIAMSQNGLAQWLASQGAPDPRVWGEIIGNGGSVDLPAPTVTGPSQVTGSEVARQNGDGTTTVTRTTYNFQTSNNTVTNTTNVTTTVTYGSSGQVTSTQTTTETPSASGAGTPQPDAQREEEKPECQKTPDVLGCMKVDTPSVDIPRAERQVSFQEESLFGAGSCPADITVTLVSTGQTLKAWDWQRACGYMLPIRAVAMAVASFVAFMILLPGGRDT